jgi:hypothetical protein
MMLDERLERALISHTLTQALDTVFKQQQRIEELEEAAMHHQHHRRATLGSAAKPTLIERPALQDMTAAQRADWYATQAAELADFASYAQRWAKRRERQGRQNENDARYQQFFTMAADLIAGLDELRQQAAAQAAEEEGNN